MNDLIDAVGTLGDEDLLDPSRHRWLAGRPLWLQIVVRSFWHPLGHLADCYRAWGRAHQALTLLHHALATARYLEAPHPVIGMVLYARACTQAQLNLLEGALESMMEAIRHNADLRVNAAQDPDLRELRDSGRLALIVAEQPAHP